jgi:lipid A 3-O-deacylase
VKRMIPAAAVALLGLAAPAEANELFGGLYVHDVDTPLSIAGLEGGADMQVGWRGSRLGPTPLQPYIFGALNTAGETSYAAAGISARFGESIYVRPGLGIAVHTGDTGDFERAEGDRIAFGNRVLLQPEIGIGAQINPRMSLEASWVHLSHGQLFGGQNPGIDNFGLRLNFRL